MFEARKEAEMVMFDALDELFAKTKVKPKDIGILVVNCSMFNPTPSLSAMVINHYNLRWNIISYNLGRMGCSAGLISIDLAKDLLQVHPNSYALVVSMENIILNRYFGNDRSKLVSNCLFRMGGAAILLSNRSSNRRRSEYRLVRTNMSLRLRADGSLKPDNLTYQYVFKAVGRLGMMKEGEKILGFAVKRGLELYTYVANSALDMYGEHGRMECVEDVFDGMSERDAVSWNVLISWRVWAREGRRSLLGNMDLYLCRIYFMGLLASFLLPREQFVAEQFRFFIQLYKELEKGFAFDSFFWKEFQLPSGGSRFHILR